METIHKTPGLLLAGSGSYVFTAQCQKETKELCAPMGFNFLALGVGARPLAHVLHDNEPQETLGNWIR